MHVGKMVLLASHLQHSRAAVAEATCLGCALDPGAALRRVELCVAVVLQQLQVTWLNTRDLGASMIAAQGTPKEHFWIQKCYLPAAQYLCMVKSVVWHTHLPMKALFIVLSNPKILGQHRILMCLHV